MSVGSIASASSQAKLAQVQQSVQMSVLKKEMNLEQDMALQLVESLKSMDIGKNIDTVA